MKITFTETHQSSLDGINIVVFQKDIEYDLPIDKAHRFINGGIAVHSQKLETKVEIPQELKVDVKAKKKK
jgi:hypothetical protein